MANDLERYWLAGLLEGEGTFIKGPPSSPRCPALRVAMTDQDVVEHAARLLERGVTPWDRKTGPPRKRVFITQIKGVAALRFMTDLRPVMGMRRRTQIDRALLAPRPGHLRMRRSDATCRVTACERGSRIRGLCTHHYKSWWKSVRYGRTPKYDPSVAVLPPAIDGGPLELTPPDDQRSIAWVAGLLEGEGTFAENSGYPLISAQMCDHDVLERAASILGISRVFPKDVERNAERGWSPSFEIRIAGSRGAELMRTLRPLMGVRRTHEVDQALNAYHPIRLTRPPAQCIVRKCFEPHRSRGLCHKHYMSWSRDLARGRPPRVRPLR